MRTVQLLVFLEAKTKAKIFKESLYFTISNLKKTLRLSKTSRIRRSHSEWILLAVCPRGFVKLLW